MIGRSSNIWFATLRVFKPEKGLRHRSKKFLIGTLVWGMVGRIKCPVATYLKKYHGQEAHNCAARREGIR